MTEARLSTANPNINLVIREKNNGFEFIRETQTTSGEEVNPDNSNETIETITITRKTLNTII
jgi:hypothetical protein